MEREHTHNLPLPPSLCSWRRSFNDDTFRSTAKNSVEFAADLLQAMKELAVSNFRV